MCSIACNMHAHTHTHIHTWLLYFISQMFLEIITSSSGNYNWYIKYIDQEH